MAILKGIATGMLLFVLFVIVDWSRLRMVTGAGAGGATAIDIRSYSGVAGLGLGVLLGARGFLALAKALEFTSVGCCSVDAWL